ncbi:macro domain-containing protein [Streptomyces luteireticuli]
MPADDETYTAILGELKAIRKAGITRLRALPAPALEQAAAAHTPHQSVEEMLRTALACLDEGTMRTAAAYTLGLAQGTRAWPGADRRRRAADTYGVSIERFRKDQEPMLLGQLAEVITNLMQSPTPAAPAGIATTHRVIHVPVHTRTIALTVHIHPVDLLRDIDVVVSPTNVFLALPEPYKSSVAASLRRAGATHATTGEMLDDPIHDELRTWAKQHGAVGRPLPPGAIAPTTAGALTDQGIRRIYHAAIAVPRNGTNDYDIHPTDITRTTTHALTLLKEEAHSFYPPLRSICFPLLGTGRGGLPYETSISALWAAVEADLARGASWDIHFIVLTAAAAALLDQLSARTRPEPLQSATNQPGSL